MEVILKEDVLNLGFENDIVSVKNGYARNYLFPKRLAIPANESNRKILAETIKQRSRKLERLKADAETIVQKLNDINLMIKVKSSEEGRIYGSVTNVAVVEALKEQFNIEIDRKKINILTGHIKELGQYKVAVPLRKDVCAEFTINVIAE
ncbi:MAG: 50S ribosomal protein L9 [Bacteroidales bacterium]|jgi:large subunit ribosomal protein L9|nr:50S ribosomal protein L9 [Bacteroidales bacterium]